ncbi:hypothetical protein BVI2075_180093 [Burkholderia vietnamiensis]|nr:hypothetical protein BVI2075_180093 [Burkholderia vietnamiensis]
MMPEYKVWRTCSNNDSGGFTKHFLLIL